ncbi:MAG: hypothetical protein H7Y18_18800 [Clostridiaceae bacterium]|nr:hypothetical protein [Clostridiaceae bacterium]
MKFKRNYSRRIYKYILNMKLRTRMIVLYSILTLLIISIMSIGFYFPTVNLLKYKQSVEMNDSINSLDKIINIRISNINQSFLGMFEDDYFKKLVARSRAGQGSNIGDAMLESEFRNYFSRYVSIDNDILESIMLVTSYGKIFSDMN